jgi:hypothetical protein
MPRQVDCKNASRARHITNAENAGVRLHAAPRNRKSEAQTRFVFAALFEGQKHLLHIPRRKAAAAVFYVDTDALAACVRVQRDIGVFVRELERVLQHVSERRKEQVAVRVHHKLRIDVRNGKPALPRQRLERSRDLDFGNEIGQGEDLVARRHARSDAHVSQGAIDEGTQPNETVVQYRARGAGQTYMASADSGKRERRCLKVISQLVSKKAQTLIQGLDGLIDDQHLALV